MVLEKTWKMSISGHFGPHENITKIRQSNALTFSEKRNRKNNHVFEKFSKRCILGIFYSILPKFEFYPKNMTESTYFKCYANKYKKRLNSSKYIAI